MTPTPTVAAPTATAPTNAPGSSTAACPEATSAAAIFSVSGKDLVRCWGGRELRFRAWVDKPFGTGCTPIGTPDWLIGCDWPLVLYPDATRQLIIIPRLRPGSGVQLGTAGRWVTVAGHFDDPAASSCRALPQASNTVGGIVEDCRVQLVVTAVEPG